MCFIEYIAYYCGHTTLPVSRTCPLATHVHTNPVCPKPAQRSTQVNWMCPACARILHGRWVEIIMFEHRWMHERGTCGCPVQFPALQQPRIVGKNAPSSAYSSDDGQGNQDSGRRQQGGIHIPKYQIEKARRSKKSSALGSVVDHAPHDEDDEYPKIVKVRMAGQYGTEWIPDHAELHREGKCKCNVHFDAYKPHELPEMTVSPSPSQQDSGFESPRMIMPKEGVYPKETVRHTDVMIWAMNDQVPEGQPKIKWPQQPEEFGFLSAAEAEEFLRARHAENAAGEAGGQPTLLAFNSQRSQPMHPQPTGNALTTINQTEVPIAGWPIGAGPEGGLENTHSPRWLSCGLSRPRPRRRLSFSK